MRLCDGQGPLRGIKLIKPRLKTMRQVLLEAAAF